MPLKAELSRHCQADLQQAFDFYEQRKPGLGTEFLANFESLTRDDYVRIIACLYGGQKPQEIEDALKERKE